ncbi:ferredoxin [Agrilactobacillus fermenti]|uniref:ferredoxin n=1 Tax=Agrilactobacillus fermenti TaxID=2586909 RepID=UPI001E329D3F|nr:ferredoxin [Agrilactobacillus fermenti]MCD2255217.1 ferredoxin [Agrilactobacillus fermenti]
MFTRVARPECIACGICQLQAPDIFDYDNEGIAYSKLDQNKGQRAIPNELMSQFKQAYQKCPTGAIKRRDVPFHLTK